MPFIALAAPVSNNKIEPSTWGEPNAPWEKLPSPNYSISLERMRIAHGWLVLTYADDTYTTFVPDESNAWTNINTSWEHLPRPHWGAFVRRMYVPQGWLVISSNNGPATFIPDENHEWVINRGY